MLKNVDRLRASALARSYPGLLSKSDPPKRRFGGGQVRGLDVKESPATSSLGAIQRACAPSARMKPPVSSLARGQGLFFAWVTLSEHKWVTSRERRRPGLVHSWGIFQPANPGTARTAPPALRRRERCDPIAYARIFWYVAR